MQCADTRTGCSLFDVVWRGVPTMMVTERQMTSASDHLEMLHELVRGFS